MLKRLQLRHSLLMGLGAAILAASRPYEGGATCLAAGAVLLVRLLGKQRPPLALSVTRFFLPMLLMLAMTAAGLGYYFFRVTGNPFSLPEAEQRIPYAMAPIFGWQPPGPEPISRHKPLRDFYRTWVVIPVLPGTESFRT